MQGTLPAPTIAALSKLVSLFALSTLSREAGDFLEDGYMTGQQARSCPSCPPSFCPPCLECKDLHPPVSSLKPENILGKMHASLQGPLWA